MKISIVHPGLARIFLAFLLLALPACNRLFDKGSEDNTYAADKKAAAGDYLAAVSLYEAALDGTPKSAGMVHYKLALLATTSSRARSMPCTTWIGTSNSTRRDRTPRTPRPTRRKARIKLLTQFSKGSPITQQGRHPA